MSDSILHGDEIIIDDCPVCMEHKDNMMTTNCGHHVCFECVDEMSIRTIDKDFDSNPRCPICRKDIVANDLIHYPNEYIKTIIGTYDQRIDAYDVELTQAKEAHDDLLEVYNIVVQTRITQDEMIATQKTFITEQKKLIEQKDEMIATLMNTL